MFLINVQLKLVYSTEEKNSNVLKDMIVINVNGVSLVLFKFTKLLSLLKIVTLQIHFNKLQVFMKSSQFYKGFKMDDFFSFMQPCF